jgi:hypothetical protein
MNALNALHQRITRKVCPVFTGRSNLDATFL